MGSLFELFATLLHAAAHPQDSVGLPVVGFSVLLVAWLVAAEEAELRRDRGSGDRPRSVGASPGRARDPQFHQAVENRLT